MKIVASYLFVVYLQNGPSSFESIIKVVELENGSFYEENNGGRGYKKFTPTAGQIAHAKEKL